MNTNRREFLKGVTLSAGVGLSAWCAVSELTERSATNRSQSMGIPDFTRGAWKASCNSNLMDASIDVSKLEFKDVERAKGQMNV